MQTRKCEVCCQGTNFTKSPALIISGSLLSDRPIVPGEPRIRMRTEIGPVHGRRRRRQLHSGVRRRQSILPTHKKTIGVRIRVKIHAQRSPSVRRYRRPILPNQSRVAARASSRTGACPVADAGMSLRHF